MFIKLQKIELSRIDNILCKYSGISESASALIDIKKFMISCKLQKFKLKSERSIRKSLEK